MVNEITEFAIALLTQWVALITGGIITAILIVYQQLSHKTIARRVYLWLLLLFFVWASFEAWREERGQVAKQKVEIEDLQKQLDDRQKQQAAAAERERRRVDQVNELSAAIQTGTLIMREFEEKNDPELIQSQYRNWEKTVLDKLSQKFDVSYVNQFASARGTALMLLNHNMEGNGWYSLVQGKLTVLNSMLGELRKNGP
jgi:hypothetical protein